MYFKIYGGDGGFSIDDPGSFQQAGSGRMMNFSFPDGGVNGAAVLGIGVFDGVHLGHRKIIAELVEMGRIFHAVPVAVTFFPHPRAVLCPDSPPRLLQPPEERLRLLHLAGAEKVNVIEFSAETAATAPELFVDELLAAHGDVRGICVGEHWRFGRGGRGDTMFLARGLERRGIAFRAVPEVRIDGVVVSSSCIREAVATGDLAGAARMLGDFPCLYGEVEPGFRIAERQLHAPTANLRTDFGVLPPDGVYAGWTELGGKRFPTVTNIGFSPTFGGTAERRVESHLIGFSGDLYRKRLAVKIAAKLRDERRFVSVSELERQIKADRAKAAEIFSEMVKK